MSTLTSRALIVSASIALGALSSGPAHAELPYHLRIQNFHPLSSECCYLPAEPPQDTWFGYAVAIRNGLAFVGMHRALTSGRVAVFTQTAEGWVRSATLTALDPEEGAEFGRSLSFRDGLLIVGSNKAAYVFKRVNGTWRQIQRIALPPGEGVGNFAHAVRHEAGILAVSAFGISGVRDSVYVFEQDASGKFLRRARLMASEGYPQDRFGTSLSMTDKVIVIGAPGNTLSGDPQSRDAAGAAYLFGRNSAGNWVQRQKLVSAETQARDHFGTAVAIDRGMILVGAPYADQEGWPLAEPTPDGHMAGGMVYGFLPGSGRYVESFKLRPRPDEHTSYMLFGATIAMFGQRIAIGGTSFPYADAYDPYAYVFTYTRNDTTVSSLGIAAGFVYSTSIGLANNWLLVGSPTEEKCLYGCIGEANLFDLNR